MDKLVTEYPDTFKVRRQETYKGEVIYSSANILDLHFDISTLKTA